MTRKFLGEQGIEFEDLDVDANPELVEEMIELSGQLGTPVISVDDNVLVGFDERKLREALQSAGHELKS